MALTKDEMRAFYPLPVYNYQVSINGESISFSQVSGLSQSHETFVHKESPRDSNLIGPVVMRMPGQPQDVTITLQKGWVRGRSIKVLYEWMRSRQLNLIDKKDIRIDLRDEKGDAVVSWKVINAFPTKLDAPSFDANSNDAAIESMELMADAVFVEEV